MKIIRLKQLFRKEIIQVWRDPRLRLLVFLRQVADRDGRLPAAAEEFMDRGMAEPVPLDPFSGGPLRYSRDRRLVWSVGPDGEDDARPG